MEQMTNEQIDKIELNYMTHESRYNLKSSQERILGQAVFFTGVMEALTAVGFTPPPIWIICMVSGRDIVENRRGKA